MGAYLDTYCYYIMVDNRPVYAGITNDPDRRWQEHQATYPNGRLVVQRGPFTEEMARVWEVVQASNGIPTGS